MEMWWNISYDQSVGMDGYRLFRKDGEDKEDVSPSMSVTSRRALDLSLWMGEELTYVIQ